MKRIVLTIFVFGAFVSCAFAQTFAQLALGGPYQAVAIITNASDKAWQGTAQCLQNSGEPWSEGSVFVNGQRVDGNKVPVYLSPRGAVKLRFTGDDTTRTGYLEISPALGYSPDALNISYFYEYRSGGQLIDSTGTDKAVWNYTFPVSVAVEKAPGVDTGVAFAPGADVGPFEINLTLYNANGNIVRTRRYPITGHEAMFVSQLFPELPESFVGHLKIDGSSSWWDIVAVNALRMELTAIGPQYTGVPVHIE